jgi:hypothetical protein
MTAHRRAVNIARIGVPAPCGKSAAEQPPLAACRRCEFGSGITPTWALDIK